MRKTDLSQTSGNSPPIQLTAAETQLISAARAALDEGLMALGWRRYPEHEHDAVLVCLEGEAVDSATILEAQVLLSFMPENTNTPLEQAS